MSTISKASSQWATRPSDERYWAGPKGRPLQNIIMATREHRARSCQATVGFGELRTEARDGEVQILGQSAAPASLTHWSFGQLARKVGAPADYLRNLPATLVAQNLNYGLARMGRESDQAGANILFSRGESNALTARCILSDSYSRLWNHEILERLESVLPAGWTVPPARPAFGYTGDTRLATADDIGAISSRNGGGVQIRVGDTLAPAGLYASDHDCFVFLVDETRGVDDGTGHNALGRGFFMWNSEVGAASFGVTTFLYDAICGNHIVWGAKDVREVRLRHVGKSLDGRAFQELRATLIDYTNDDASTTEAKIREARTMVIGASKEDVIKAIFGKISGVSQRLLGESYDAAELSPRYGAPNTLWGMVNGMTEVSQRSGHTDDRTRIDRAAGELLGIAF